MAINRLQFGGLLNPKESFGWEEYGQPGPQITTPSLLGAGVFGDVAGKKLRTQRGLSCPTGTQPNASNTACVPIQKTGTCPAGTTGVWPNCTPIKVSGGTCPPGTTGVWPNCKPITGGGNTCPDGTTGVWPNCKPIGEDRGCIYGRDKYGNCIDPTGGSDWYDYVDPGMEPWAKATGPEPGGGPEDWRGPAAGFGTDIGSRVGNAVVGPDGRLQFRGLTDDDRSVIAGQGMGTSDLAGALGYHVPQGFDDFGAMSAPGIQLFPNERPAPLSTEDFIAQYSRPSKTVEQGILGPDQEGAEARRIAEMQSEVYGMDNLLTPSPRARVTAGPTAAEIRNEASAQQGREQSQRMSEARDRLDDIKDSQAAEKASNKANEKSRAAQQKAEEAKGAAARANTAASKAKAQKAVNEAHKAMMAATTAGVKSIKAKAKVSGGYQPSFKYTAGGGYTGGF